MGTFLIADDSPEKMTMLRSVLEKHWHGEIVTAETTEAAIDLIDQEAISAAFIDYYIPKKLGPAVIKHLKEKNPVARIALVTSSSGSHIAEEARHAGAEEVVCTSHEADVVERQLGDLIEHWSSK